MAELLQIRVHGDPSLPVLIYLPGLHGDWTLIGGFRQHASSRVRFVELTYPRTLDWTLDDYATAIETALAQQGITAGWLLGESFGSQILWTLVKRGRFQAEGIVLAGGFVQHPLCWAARLAEITTGSFLFALFVRAMFGFTRFGQIRYRKLPDAFAMIHEFSLRRTKDDARAAVHRLHLVAGSDPRSTASTTRIPVFHLTGWLDPIVPWPFVRHWLRKNCPALRSFKMINTADHNVLVTAPREAAAQILAWMNVEAVA